MREGVLGNEIVRALPPWGAKPHFQLQMFVRVEYLILATLDFCPLLAKQTKVALNPKP